MLFKSFLGAALAAVASATYDLSLIYQFDNSFSGFGYVNIENVAVRSSNGQLLLNFATGAIMAQLNPANPQPEVLVNISAAYPGAPGSLTGIAETGHDVYTVAAGNFAFGPQVPGGVMGIPGSFSVWSVDLTGPKAVAKQIVAIPEAGALNGLTTIPGHKDIVLIADSGVGTIWSVNITDGTYKSLTSTPLFQPAPGINNLGINGIHIQGDHLYFTNSAQNIFGGYPINADGSAAGEVIPFATGVNGTFFDDFALDKNGDAYIATHPNAITKVSRSGLEIIAGGGDDMTLLGPTSCVGKGDTLYVVTGGAFGPTGPVSGQVFSINLSSFAKRAEKKWVA